VANKDALVLWEAQFGDFVNGAQIIIDQFLVAAEDKWGQTSGLVLLLPHGYEGRAPSTPRPHRALPHLCAEDNIQVANATTAAQYFHLLRRQMRREVRKPLVVFTPKSLLRAKEARSPVDELTEGRSRRCSTTRGRDPSAVRAHRVLPAGKVGHDAIAARRARRTGRRRARRAALPVARDQPWPRSLERYPTPPRSSGSRRSPRTWARGTS
jgi:multifunctional 2-oxoglutarate metabolism enzyme